MAQVQRRMVLCNMNLHDIYYHTPGLGYAMTPSVQIPNGSTKITVQFKYYCINDPVTCTLYQSLDGINFDECESIDEMSVGIILDIASASATLNISELLTTWIRFKVTAGNCSAGVLDKFLCLFAA